MAITGGFSTVWSGADLYFLRLREFQVQPNDQFGNHRVPQLIYDFSRRRL